MAALIVDPKRLDGLTPEDPGFHTLIATPRAGSTVERLRVYAGGYPARIHDTLTETFPTVAHVLGHRAFTALVQRYINSVPLGSYNLNDAGAELPQFLANDRQTRQLPFLPDLSRLEWQVARAFHADEHAPFDPAALAHWTIDEWERAVLSFQPWVALVASDWPIREIWEHQATPVAEIDIDLQSGASRILVRRDYCTVHCESLDAAEADALGALLGGRTLGSVISALTADGGDAANVSEWFAGWGAKRMITDCTLGR
jgi:uncharacterized protein